MESMTLEKDIIRSTYQERLANLESSYHDQMLLTESAHQERVERLEREIAELRGRQIQRDELCVGK